MKIFRLLFTSISFCFLSHLCSTLESTAPFCNTLRCATILASSARVQHKEHGLEPGQLLACFRTLHSTVTPRPASARSAAMQAEAQGRTLDGHAECVVELAKRQCHCLRPDPSSRQWQSEVIEECGLLI